MNTTFRSDRRFEFEKFKRFELSGWKRYLFLMIWPLMGIFYVFYIISMTSGLYTVIWAVYALFFTVIYPIVLIYESTKPKTYEIVSTGIRINGHLIRWKNFKEIVESEDMIGLKMHYGTVIALPKEFKGEVLKHMRSGRDSLITPQQGGPSSSQP